MAELSEIGMPDGVFPLFPSNFYCVSYANCCATEGDEWANVFDVASDLKKHSSAIWGEDSLALDHSFKIEAEIMHENDFAAGEGFALVLQRDGVDALGEDSFLGYGTIDGVVPVVTFESEPLDGDGAYRFKVSIPEAEGWDESDEVVYLAKSLSVGFSFRYNEADHLLEVLYNDKFLLDGTINLETSVGNDSAYWGFTLSAASVQTPYNCVEDTINPTMVQVFEKEEEEDEDEDEDEDEEYEDEDEDEDEEYEDEDEEDDEDADNESEESDEDEEVPARVVDLVETFEQEGPAPWSFVNNMFGAFGNPANQMLGLLGGKVGEAGSAGMRVRLLEEPGNPTTVAAGFQHQFMLDRKARNAEISLFFKTDMDPLFTDSDSGEVLVQLDGKDHGFFTCRGVDECTSSWETIMIDLGPLSAGHHILQIGSILHNKSDNLDRAKVPRRFDARVDNIHLKLIGFDGTVDDN